MLAFLFPGQGSVRPGMGAEICQGWPEARAVYEQARRVTGVDVAELSFHGSMEQLVQTASTHLAVFTQSMATAAVLREAGVVPGVTAGHSLGQWAACTAAGCLPLEKGFELVAERGRLIAEACALRPGAMVALPGTTESEAAELIRESGTEGRVVLANVNGPRETVLSGESEAVQQIFDLARARRLQPVLLRVQGAFHSPLMAGAAGAFRRVVEAQEFRDPDIPVVCGATGRILKSGEEVREAFLNQIMDPVRWDRTLESIAGLQPDRWLEVGPGKVLTGLLLRWNRRAQAGWSETATALRSFLQAAAGQAGDPGEARA